MKRLVCLLLTLCLLPLAAPAYAKTLRPGSEGEAVLALQKRLLALGLSAGSADGIYGQQTASAVSSAQWLLRAAGYDVAETGEADDETLALLFDVEAQNALLTLRRGSKGARVKELQNRLIDLGVLHDMADGAFGAQTEAAVHAFQARMNLPEDGVVTLDLHDLIFSDSRFAAPVDFDPSDPLSLTPELLYSPSFLLMDVATGEVLMEQNADERMYPASTTKILTLLTALAYGGDLDETVTVPESAADIPADSSRMPVVPGEKLRMIDLLYGLMMRSGNDAANAVAELYAGSVEAFVQEMNEYAQALGMTNTHFVNPHGYHDQEHYTTARDLARAAHYAMANPQFGEIVTCLSYPLPATNKREATVLQNPYEIFDPASSAYIPGAAGVKSGYTSAAGFCYVGAAQREGRTLIAVILHTPGRDRGWRDLSCLFEYGFATLGV